MPIIDIRPSLSIAYEDDCFAAPWSAPQAILLVHGNSESSRAWTQWVPYLAGTYRVVRLDLPGFGASTAPPDYRWSAPEVAADIGRFLDALKIERCHLIGAKYGGSIALQLASDQPQRFLSLCIFGSPARGVGTGNADKIRAKGVGQWAAETMRARLGSTASEAQIAWWTELMGATDQRAALGSSSALVTMDLDDRLPLIAAPSLIVTTRCARGTRSRSWRRCRGVDRRQQSPIDWKLPERPPLPARARSTFARSRSTRTGRTT
jgi:pimeloyl-ACP methyl ester carboxylesterase